ncbi:alpha/beta fold hydrolase [Flaviaesturariibacter amylovorans]|uniref:Alpha/beta hydrolase n=1 Tax=Flaviaesturariibacter amylovorans TaxID=1084520 RepID=A0ABP8HUT2_9BACT
MKSLLLLHGALGSADQLRPLAEALPGHYDLHSLQLPGHGGVPAGDGGFSVPAFAGFVERYIQEKGLDRPSVFGYSMGGYVALHLAATRPELIGAVATLATKLDWTPEGAAREAAGLQPDVIEQKVPAFAAALRERHYPLNWKEVLANTASLMQELGRAPLLTDGVLASLTLPVLLLLGDRDNMVTLEETVNARRTIPGAQLGVLPATPHPLEKADPKLLAALLQRFFGS